MKRIVLVVEPEDTGRRLDRYLTTIEKDRSRSEVQRDIRGGRVTVEGTTVRQPSRRLRPDERIEWTIPEHPMLVPRALSIDVLYEDDQLVVVDKPTHLVVHPGAGTVEPTLVEGLLVDRALPPSDDPVRPGIVHRLDKETSGLLLVAKTADALRTLQRQFAERTVLKAYLAVVAGTIAETEATIDAPVGRDPANPRRMSVVPNGRIARTDLRVLRRFTDCTLLLAWPRTGRTHQLRVHLHYIGHPVVGDAVYARRAVSETDERLMLHAWRIEVRHPGTGAPVRFEAPVPAAFPPFLYEDIPWSAPLDGR